MLFAIKNHDDEYLTAVPVYPCRKLAEARHQYGVYDISPIRIGEEQFDDAIAILEESLDGTEVLLIKSEVEMRVELSGDDVRLLVELEEEGKIQAKQE